MYCVIQQHQVMFDLKHDLNVIFNTQGKELLVACRKLCYVKMAKVATGTRARLPWDKDGRQEDLNNSEKILSDSWLLTEGNYS